MNRLFIKTNYVVPVSIVFFMLVGSWTFSLTSYAQTEPQVEVTVARANIRSGPSTNYAVIAKATRGDTFVIRSTNTAKNWYQIALNDSQSGWIADSIVTVIGTLDGVSVANETTITTESSDAPTATPTTEKPANGEVTVQVNRARVNLRSGPGTNYSVVSKASQGDRFAVTGRNNVGNWFAVQLTDGTTAWVYANIVLVQGDTQSIATVDSPVATTNESTVGVPTPTATPQTISSTDPANDTENDATDDTVNSTVSTLPPGVASGRLLYSVANDDAKRWELWEYNFGTQSNAKIADWRTELDISNDGRQIAYFAWPGDAGEKVGIWIMDADFTNNRLLVPGGAYPSFNPGGDRLVVNGPNGTMYLINSDGGGLRPLAKGEYPAWSPTDNRIVHRDCVGGSCGLWVIDANSNDPTARQHITTGGSDGQPAWSPDGKRIAYISKEDGNFEIYVANSDGSNPVRVTSDPASDGLPVWSPDGRWLAFRSDRGGSWAIYIVRPDGSNLYKVIDADVLDYWFFEKMIWR